MPHLVADPSFGGIAQENFHKTKTGQVIKDLPCFVYTLRGCSLDRMAYRGRLEAFEGKPERSRPCVELVAPASRVPASLRWQ
jgi:hypothetical protein